MTSDRWGWDGMRGNPKQVGSSAFHTGWNEKEDRLLFLLFLYLLEYLLEIILIPIWVTFFDPFWNL
jgi:hypothetical protein